MASSPAPDEDRLAELESTNPGPDMRDLVSDGSQVGPAVPAGFNRGVGFHCGRHSRPYVTPVLAIFDRSNRDGYIAPNRAGSALDHLALSGTVTTRNPI